MSDRGVDECDLGSHLLRGGCEEIQGEVEGHGGEVLCDNKNGEVLLERYGRYVAGESEQSDRVRKGVMFGSYARLWRQCAWKEDLVMKVEEDLWECLVIGTEWKVVAGAMGEMTEKGDWELEEWRNAKRGIKRRLRQKWLAWKSGTEG